MKLLKNKLLRRILIILSIILVFLFIAGVGLGFIYGDKVKKIIVTELGNQIITPITVEKIEFSFLRKFPYASLDFKNVVIPDSLNKDNKKGFMDAGHIYLKFNILDLMRKKYVLRRIEVEDATLNLIVNKDETDNYHIMKSTESDTGDFKLNLQKVFLKNVEINYINRASDLELEITAIKAFTKGEINNDIYDLDIEGDFDLGKFAAEKRVLFENQSLKTKLVFKVDNTKELYQISKGNLQLNNLKFIVAGSVVTKGAKSLVDIDVKGSKLDLKSLIKELPESYAAYFDDYKAEGIFFFNLKIKGLSGGNALPHISANFGIQNGLIQKRDSKVKLENLTFNADFDNGNENKTSSSKLIIRDFVGKLNSGNIAGSLSITNFISPTIESKLTANLNINELLQIFPIDTITSANGQMAINATFKSSYNPEKGFTPADFLHSTTTGNIALTNVNFTLKGNSLEFKNINTKLDFSNNDLVINTLTGNISNTDFNLNGYFRNALAYIFLQNEHLEVDGSLTSGFVDLNQLLDDQSDGEDTSYNLTFPEKIGFNVNVSIGKLIFGKFTGTNMSGNVKLRNQKLIGENLAFNSMDGQTRGSGVIDGSENGKLKIRCNAEVSNVNVEKMFYEMGNFYQDELTDKNLKGIISGQVIFSGNWSNALYCDYNSIYSKLNISVVNGRLMNYEPMQELSSFLRVADLSNIEFNKLENTIEIANQKISIPLMTIESTALNLTLFGTHTFDNVIDYHIQFYFSDVMLRKVKAAKKENDEFIEEDDGLGKPKLFIWVSGTVDDPIVKYDKREVKKKIKDDLKQQNQVLKESFKEEFYWFTKDTTHLPEDVKKKRIEKQNDKNKIKKQEEGNFIIEMPDDF